MSDLWAGASTVAALGTTKKSVLPVNSVNGEKPYGEWLKDGTRDRMVEAGGGQSQAHRNRTAPQAQTQPTAMSNPP